jgi:23S rRNA (cytosine1962-C5)-methyltransferase
VLPERPFFCQLNLSSKNGITCAYFCKITKVFLNKKMNERIAVGHPWIFGNDLQPIPPDSIKAGSLVEVYTIDKKWIGIGYFNPKSPIAVRLLTRK